MSSIDYIQKHSLTFSRVYVALVTVILQEMNGENNITMTTVIQRYISLIYGWIQICIFLLLNDSSYIIRNG